MKKTKKTRAALAAKIASIVGIIVIVAMIGFGLSACGGDDGGGGNGGGNGTHTHTYSTTWSSNATQHWKECTGADCEAKTETANHQYVYTVTSTTYPAESTPTCSVCSETGTARETGEGDTGPAGGIIFYVGYISVVGYSGGTGAFDEYTAYYMEAAPANESDFLQWGAYGTLIADVTTYPGFPEYSIGNGRKDTQIIVNHLATTEETGTAAQVCASKTVTVGGTVFNDWFMPSIGEVTAMYNARSYFGISSGGFLSSTQVDSDFALAQSFKSNNFYVYSNVAKNDNWYSVRAIRVF